MVTRWKRSLKRLNTASVNPKSISASLRWTIWPAAGAIGKVAAVLGSLLKIKPVITCNVEGAYAIAAKVRGRAHAINETITLAVAEAKKCIACSVAVVDGNAKDEAARVMQQIKQLIPNCKSFIEGTVGPALAVHTGQVCWVSMYRLFLS